LLFYAGRLKGMEDGLSFFISLQFIHVAYAGAIAAVEPILTIIFSKFLLKAEEQLTPMVLVIGLLIFLGAGVIAFTG
jgi:drug/metabolite transporter (DMT)-like permease